MAKLFKLALESSDLEGAVASEPAQPALDESELEQNVEETTAQQAEIEQGEEEIDQALEEADGLVEQIEANDEKLENPDAVVTAADVEVSEEALKRACYSLGIPFQAKLSFAQESVTNDIRSNARKYLQTSNEELKDKLKTIVDAVKKMITSVINKVQTWFAQVSLKLGNYKARIEKNEKALKESNTPLSREVKNALFEQLKAKNDTLINYSLITSEFNPVIFDNIVAIIKTSEERKLDPVAIKNIDFSLYGVEAPKENNIIVCGVMGDVGLCLDTTAQAYVKVKLQPAKNGLDENKFNEEKLTNNALSSAQKYKNAVNNAKSIFERISKLQKSILKDIDGYLKENKDDKEFKDMMNKSKSMAITSCAFNIQEYIANIKAYTTITDALIKARSK